MADAAELTVRLDAQVEARLADAARELQRSQDELVLEAITAWLDLRSWQASEIEAGLREADAGDFASEEEVEATFRKWGV